MSLLKAVGESGGGARKGMNGRHTFTAGVRAMGGVGIVEKQKWRDTLLALEKCHVRSAVFIVTTPEMLC